MTRRKTLIAMAALVAVVVSATAGLGAAGFVVNRSDSMPLGIWRVHDEQFGRGSVVLICPDDGPIFQGALRSHYLNAGACPGGFAPLLKPVAAIAGDQVLVTDQGVSVNGALVANSALMRVDGAGRLLPRNQLGAHRVRPGEVWLLSSYNPYSFDSRYFGPLPAARVRGVARPVRVRAG